MANILDVLQHETSGDVHLWSLPNVKGEAPERWIGTRSEARFRSFVQRYDQRGRGTFFCVSTMKAGERRNKANALEMPFLFCDVDGKDLDISLDEVEARLKKLECASSRLHHTGNGYHAFWMLHQPIAGEQDFQRAEGLLKRLAGMLGGDRQVCHRAALLRLPGSHNSKRGEWKAVRTTWEGRERYSLDDLERWLDSLREPVIAKRMNVVSAAGYNPFLEIAERQGFRPRIDVFARLRDMRPGAPGDQAVHPTQLSCTAALMHAGVDINDAVSLVLDATMELPGTQGWNWLKEEQEIRAMCTDYLKNFPKTKRTA